MLRIAWPGWHWLANTPITGASVLGLGRVKTPSYRRCLAAMWAKLRSAVILPGFLSFPFGNSPDAGGGRLGRLCGM